MRKMSYLLLCAALGFVTGCSDNDQQQPVKKNELGLIVPQINASANSLLLKDGTVANPISGIPDFNSRSAGGKLLLSYRTVSVENGITNIAVTHFAEANDSTFTVELDETEVPVSLYGETFSGTYFITNEDSTTTYMGEVSFVFGAAQSGASSYTYTFTPATGASVSGTGEFIWDGEIIEFLNNEDEDFIVPFGSFTYSAHVQNTVMYIWKVTETNAFFSYALEIN